MDRQTNGQKDGRTDERTVDGRTVDGQPDRQTALSVGDALEDPVLRLDHSLLIRALHPGEIKYFILLYKVLKWLFQCLC